MKQYLTFFLIWISCGSYSQKIDPMYLKAYQFIGVIYKEQFNVSPVIKYIGISPFNSQLNRIDSSLISEEMQDPKLYYQKNYFEPFFNNCIDSVFKNIKEYNMYLLFSKSNKNHLLVELRKGRYSDSNFKQPYFGTADKFLLFFDTQGNIVKHLRETIKYN
ncbi:MAG: hypothetical protein ACK4S0_01615 [Sediminibacterium sp.]